MDSIIQLKTHHMRKQRYESPLALEEVVLLDVLIAASGDTEPYTEDNGYGEEYFN